MSAGVLDLGLPPLDPRSIPVVFSAVVEHLLRLDLPPEKAAPMFAALVDHWQSLLGAPAAGSPVADSWNEWFEFCDSFPAPSARSYLEILEDEDRRGA